MKQPNEREATDLSTVETGVENAGLELTKEGENPERTRRTEEQGQNLGDGLRSSTHQRYRSSRTGSVRT